MRISRRLCAFFLFAVIFSIPLSASMISILVVETGLRDGNNTGLYSSLWEDSLMSAFFDAGHIVTNGNILRLEAMPSKALPDEVEKDFEDAAQGGAKYFVLALIQYDNVNGGWKPREVSLRMFSVKSRGMLFQNTLPAGNGTNLNDEYIRAREAVRTIIPHIKEQY